MQQLARNIDVPLRSFGRVYNGLGGMDAAWGWYEKAIDEHDADRIHFAINPFYDAMRSYLRYRAMLGKMKLAP